jgi:metallo-beta-lactamase family protein
MLKDSAHIQFEDAKYLSRKLKPGHPRFDPLYDDDDVDGLMNLVETIPFHEWHSLGDDVRVRFLPAGHILGSAIVELELRDNGQGRTLTFSGDLGRRNMPLLVDPETIDGCDVLICESTYGNRTHPASSDLKAELARIVREASAVGGRVIIPAFSLERTQQVVYYLNDLFNTGKLTPIPVFVDSPLATRVTQVFRRHSHIMNDDVSQTMRSDKDIFGFDGLTYIGSQEESRALNSREGAFVVISAGGMCEGGRVVHHLKHAVRHEENTVCLIGYQAPYTLGRQIQERRPYVRIFDFEVPLKAHVEVLNGLSGHADADDLKWWFSEANQRGHIGKAFLVHGEPEAAQALAQAVRDDCDEDPIIPKLYESFEV